MLQSLTANLHTHTRWKQVESSRKFIIGKEKLSSVASSCNCSYRVLLRKNWGENGGSFLPAFFFFFFCWVGALDLTRVKVSKWWQLTAPAKWWWSVPGGVGKSGKVFRKKHAVGLIMGEFFVQILSRGMVEHSGSWKMVPSCRSWKDFGSFLLKVCGTKNVFLIAVMRAIRNNYYLPRFKD